MTIFNDKLCLPVVSLYYPYSYVIMPVYPQGNKEDWSHDHNAGGILHCRRAGKTAQSLKRNNHRLAQEGRYRLVQGRAAVACEPHRFREVHAESAQSIASQEAQNVESLSSNLSAKLLDNRPRFFVQANSLVRTTPLCKHTAENGIAQRKRMSLQVVWCAQGGKCVAL